MERRRERRLAGGRQVGRLIAQRLDVRLERRELTLQGRRRGLPVGNVGHAERLDLRHERLGVLDHPVQEVEPGLLHRRDVGAGRLERVLSLLDRVREVLESAAHPVDVGSGRETRTRTRGRRGRRGSGRRRTASHGEHRHRQQQRHGNSAIQVLHRPTLSDRTERLGYGTPIRRGASPTAVRSSAANATCDAVVTGLPGRSRSHPASPPRSRRRRPGQCSATYPSGANAAV